MSEHEWVVVDLTALRETLTGHLGTDGLPLYDHDAGFHAAAWLSLAVLRLRGEPARKQRMGRITGTDPHRFVTGWLDDPA